MIILVMGVAGSGKTTVGRLLAASLGWPFFEGDDFHPAANVAKMSQGIPLNDEDREPWLAKLEALVRALLDEGRSAVIACSALKEAYRDRLVLDHEKVKVVYLRGDFDLIRQRLQQRPGHFMKASQLHSQFETLEEPAEAIIVDIALSPAALVAVIRPQLNLEG